MEGRPVRLRVARSSDVSVRYHIGKFAEREPVVVKSWGGLHIHHVTDLTAQPLQVAPMDPFLSDRTPEEREAALVDRNKLPVVMRDAAGTKEFHGKRLAQPGCFALLSEEADGSYSLVPVREWFDFAKKSSVIPFDIEQVEALISDNTRKSVQEATMINRKLGADKVAADALEREALRARMSVIDAKEEAREEMGSMRGSGGGGGDGDGQDIDFEFEWSDDDDAATVMRLATDDVNAERDERKADSNPLQARPALPEGITASFVKGVTQRRQAEAEPSEGAKRERTEDGPPPEDKAEKKKRLKPAVLAITEEGVAAVLRENANITVQQLMLLFKPSIGGDPDKKNRWLKIVTKIAIQKNVGGKKVLRLREGAVKTEEEAGDPN